MNNKIYKMNIDGKDLIIEIKDLAEQANGSVLVRYGDTVVLTTCVMSKREREDINFFPLSVDYEEKYYAAGKILGARYIRRESRPTDEAILTARLIDRAIRPKFPKGLKKDVQIIATCLSWDSENDPDILGLIGTSTALSISDIPWNGPIAGFRAGRIDGKFILNPNYEEREKSDLDLVLSATENNNEILINMIEAEAEGLEEKIILEAIEFTKPYFKKFFDFQKDIIKEFGKEKMVIEPLPVDHEMEKEFKDFLGDKLEKALSQPNKTEQENRIDTLREDLNYFIEEKYPGMGKVKQARAFFEKEEGRIFTQKIIEQEIRPDGRKLDEIRKLNGEISLLPRTHGSGLFARGQTKALSILTLGAPSDQKLLEGMEIRGKKRFMHHYNFPPYSVGETKPMRGPARRDIGHGMLAEKALSPLIPGFDEFPYTIRIVSEILSSNGSSSMASVCSSSLALMDAGVPIKSHVAGIAMGLVAEHDDKGISKYKILTDIQGPEDHHGDMDFKVAGTKKGVTAIQLDVKIDGINEEIIKETLTRAKKCREEILDTLSNIISNPRESLSIWAPKISILQINPEKIRNVIGSGGKVINEIIDKCEVSIDIEDSGRIFVTAEKEEAIEKAVSWIKNLTREVKPGEVFQGKVKRIMDFGAFVEILPGQEGLVHISKLSSERVRKVEDVVSIGDLIPVEVISIDEQGRINLSLIIKK